MRKLECLGDEVWPDDLQPERIPQHIRAGALSQRFVHDIPDLDLAFVASNDGVNVLAHSLQQFFPRCARSVVTAIPAAETSPKPAATELICRRWNCARSNDGCGVGGRRIRSREYPGRRLAMPHKRVTDDIHFIA